MGGQRWISAATPRCPCLAPVLPRADSAPGVVIGGRVPAERHRTIVMHFQLRRQSAADYHTNEADLARQAVRSANYSA